MDNQVPTEGWPSCKARLTGFGRMRFSNLKKVSGTVSALTNAFERKRMWQKRFLTPFSSPKSIFIIVAPQRRSPSRLAPCRRARSGRVNVVGRNKIFLIVIARVLKGPVTPRIRFLGFVEGVMHGGFSSGESNGCRPVPSRGGDSPRHKPRQGGPQTLYTRACAIITRGDARLSSRRQPRIIGTCSGSPPQRGSRDLASNLQRAVP
jgi:hypothetical protein